MEKLKELIRKETEKRTKNIVQEFEKIKEIDENYYFKSLLTNNKIIKYKAGEIGIRDLIDFAIKKEIKQQEKALQNKLARVDRVSTDPATIDSITILAQPNSGGTWTASVVVEGSQYFPTFTGRAGGYGYDKESACVGEALNKIDALMFLLYQFKNERLTQEHIDNILYDNRDIIEYGAGYGAIPYFEGGVGIDCHIRILQKLGFKLITRRWTNGSYIYVFTRKELEEEGNN